MRSSFRKFAALFVSVLLLHLESPLAIASSNLPDEEPIPYGGPGNDGRPAPIPAAPKPNDQTYQTLPFSQNWTSTAMIAANDTWSGVAGVEGYLGQDITTVTGSDPQTLLGVSALGADLDVIANQASPSTLTSGGVSEFDGIADPTIALQGSGTADAPHVIFYLNTTGFTSIQVAYNLRDIDAAVDNAVQPVALQYRVGTSGNFTNVPAGFVADASTGPSLATLVTPVSATLPAACNNQPQVQVRVITANAVGSDEWIGIDDISVTGTPTGGPPNLTVTDVTQVEGNGGTTTFGFSVNLSAPAPAGGVTFDITTADNSATLANSDYVLNSLTGQVIVAGNSSYAFNVTVNGDTTPEPNETFFVNVTSVVGANVTDGQGLGTITNDDVTPINQIQGNGATSPLSGSVTTRGIVTAVKSNGFFLQTPDASADADPLTSEGIFVFTSAAPPAQAAVGNDLTVTGTIADFVPTQDPFQPPVTELTSPGSYVVNSSGNPLPAAIAITAAMTQVNNIENLENLEGMRVSVASVTVVGPTRGVLTEAAATSVSNGEFYSVITGLARPFREAGIQANDPVPAGSGVTIPPVPRWDANPERLRIESDTQTGAAAIDVTTGATVTGIIGVLDYAFRTWTIYPDPSPVPVVVGGMSATPVAAITPAEFTVATANVQRFYDTSDDALTSDVVLTPAAFANRLAKVSDAVRNSMRFPDIIGFVEIENLTTLQAIASRISTDAIANAQTDPLYVAYLSEGNDVGGIDIGFLVRTSAANVGPFCGGASTDTGPRVTVGAVVQEGLLTTWTDPRDNTAQLLNDRPPLRLMATIHNCNGTSIDVTVIANHLRSLNGISDEGPDGLTTVGNRVRQKRRAQAEYLANLVQARQTGNPAEKIILVGDFNALEVNDGYVDSLGTILGTPTAAGSAVLTSADLVSPDFTNLLGTSPASERYSYTFSGTGQNLDHVLANGALLTSLSGYRLEHARINADFNESARNGSDARRLADHDPTVGYFNFAPTFPVELVRFTAE